MIADFSLFKINLCDYCHPSIAVINFCNSSMSSATINRSSAKARNFPFLAAALNRLFDIIASSKYKLNRDGETELPWGTPLLAFIEML
jgi:hypothetical protein